MPPRPNRAPGTRPGNRAPVPPLLTRGTGADTGNGTLEGRTVPPDVVEDDDFAVIERAELLAERYPDLTEDVG